MAVDLSEFHKLAPKPKKPPCGLAPALAALKPGERASLRAALDRANGIPAGAIMAWLKQRGHNVSNPAITAHRDGTCACADD